MATTALLLPPLCFREEDSNGQPLAFGTVQSFQAGTVTPVATYTDSTGATPNANPLTLNNRGEANIWILPNVGYKFLVKDSAGNQIRVVDNVQQAQLLTLYGGVDSGAVNAYVLNFVASFSSYTDGTVIYWFPSNTNTGASTLNVNSLGVIPIINGDTTPVRAGQIGQNQPTVVIYQSGKFILASQSQSSGTFTGTLTGMTASVTGTCSWTRNGNQVILTIPAMTGTSNSTSMTMTGIPAAINPALAKEIPIAGLEDNTVASLSGSVIVTAANQLNFQLGVVSGTKVQNGNTSFTAAGTKGISQQISLSFNA